MNGPRRAGGVEGSCAKPGAQPLAGENGMTAAGGRTDSPARPAPKLPTFPASPHAAACILMGLLVDVADAQRTQTLTYCQSFLEAEGAQEQRRAIAAQQAAPAQHALDTARAVLEAYRLQAGLAREVTR